RKKLSLLQEKLAEFLNIASKTVQRWEWGKRQPRMEEIKKLCEVLHVSEAELLNEPQGDGIKLTLSWHWEEIKEGEVNMDSNKFQIVLGDSGQIGITGAALFKTRDAIEDFINRVREQVTIAFDAQVRRGAIKEASRNEEVGVRSEKLKLKRRK
ncbi:MAG: helix-turn-helix transcriptional regulator, partial [Synergistaceae bacterium]|nr:helix-turn-helix transcriptional regulator [Synergistaceae bacterium]